MALPATEKDTRRASRDAGIRLVLAMAVLMWVLEVVDAIANHQLDQYGIEPRDPDGLPGVVFAPFLHAGFDHLLSNTIPFVVLGIAIALSGLARVIAVTAIVIVVGGLGTWLVAPENTIHIGASGIVFGYASYLIARGVFDRSLLELAMGAVVAVIWGGVLLGGLVPQDGISWQGHLFGAIGGVVAARVLSRRRDDDSARKAAGRLGPA
jgi:membrane associated rhomboid family serine protease